MARSRAVWRDSLRRGGPSTSLEMTPRGGGPQPFCNSLEQQERGARKRPPHATEFFAVRLLGRRAVALADLVPVDHIPPGGEIVGALVLVFQVVGMLPDIDTENRSLLGVHQRVVLIRSADDFQLAGSISDDPSPTGTEAARASLVDRVLEGIETTEVVDGFLERATWLGLVAR